MIAMSLLSLLPDILPMIIPSEVQVTKASDLEAQRAGKDSAMIRQGAVVGKTDKMCATGEKPPPKRRWLKGRVALDCVVFFPGLPPETVLIAKANCASAVHHHGEQGGFAVPNDSCK